MRGNAGTQIRASVRAAVVVRRSVKLKVAQGSSCRFSLALDASLDRPERPYYAFSPLSHFAGRNASASVIAGKCDSNF